MISIHFSKNMFPKNAEHENRPLSGTRPLCIVRDRSVVNILFVRTARKEQSPLMGDLSKCLSSAQKSGEFAPFSA
jgi:hypothetical protein